MTLIVRFKGDMYEETPIVPTPSGPMVFLQGAWTNILTDEDLVRSIGRIDRLPRSVPIQPGILVARYYLNGSDQPPRELPVYAVDFDLREYYVASDGDVMLAEHAEERGERYGGVWPATETDDEASR